MLALMLSRRTIPHPPRVRRSGPCTCLSLECADFSGWRSTSSVCESSTSSVCYLKLGAAQCSGNCADVAADDDDADVVLRAGVGSSSIFRIPCPKCDHGSFSPLAITDRSIAHPSLLLRSGIALACAPPLAISDRPHHYDFIIYRSTFHHHLRIPDPPPNSALGGPNTIKNNKMKTISNGVVIPRGVNGCRRCRRARMLWYEWFAGGPTVVRDCARILG